jgi:hypothetical protein
MNSTDNEQLNIGGSTELRNSKAAKGSNSLKNGGMSAEKKSPTKGDH